MNFNFSMNHNNDVDIPRAVDKASSTIGIIISLVVGLGFVAIGLFSIMQADRAKDWPTTQATVTNSDTIIDQDSDGDRRTEYHITYMYTVDGTARESTSTFSSNRSARSNFQLKYNPDNPSETFSGSNSIIFWIFPIVGLLIITFTVARLIKSKSRKGSSITQEQTVTTPSNQPLVDRFTGAPFNQPRQAPTQSHFQPQAPPPLAVSSPVSTNQQQQGAATSSLPDQFQK